MKSILVLAVLCAAFAVAFGTECGGNCVVDSDCNGQTCQQCMGGKCGSGCQYPCVLDQDCRDPNCKYCYEGVCGNSPNRMCNQTCQINTDCNQNTDCVMCIGNVCTAGCGMPCANSSECTSGPCRVCLLNQCAKDDVQCGSACVSNLDCYQGSYCNLCLGGLCGAGCGMACSVDAQCIGTNCNYCNNGSCKPEPSGRTCGESCRVDSDCNGTPGSCNQCVGGKCGSVCGKACKESTDCITHGCQFCNMTSGLCGYN